MSEKFTWLTSSANRAALWKDSDIAVGWIPRCNNFSAASNRAPAITTTEVVPSPASISWALDNSTNWNKKICFLPISHRITLSWIRTVYPINQMNWEHIQLSKCIELWGQEYIHSISYNRMKNEHSKSFYKMLIWNFKMKVILWISNCYNLYTMR